MQEHIYLTRRSLFKLGLSTAVLGVMIGDEVQLRDDEKPYKRERFLITLESKNQLGVLLGFHGDKGVSKKVDKLKVEDIFQPTGALFVDFLLTSNHGPLARANEVRWKSEHFYHDLFMYAQEHKVPVIFGDLKIIDEKKREISKNKNMVQDLIPLAALVSMHCAEGVHYFSKRQLLQKLFLGLENISIFAAAFSVAPKVIDLLREFGIKPQDKVGGYTQAIIADLCNPRNTDVVIRNIVWALKAVDLVESGVVPADKIMTIAGGGGHAHIKLFLENPSFAKKYWQLIDATRLAVDAGFEIESLYKSYIFDLDTSSSVRVEHQDLKDLVTN